MSGPGVRPDKSASTKWEVYDTATGAVIRGGITNAEAWKLVDRMTMEATSRGESVSDWLWSQRVHGE